MKAASISEIKAALKERSPVETTDLLLRLARYKKENKELLTYLLFDADDLTNYLQQVKEEMDTSFAEMNKANLHWAKKSIRKILRFANKHIRYTGSTEAEIELLLHFCISLKGSKIPINKSAALMNLYESQIKKINAAIDTLHEDLQHDYRREVERLG